MNFFLGAQILNRHSPAKNNDSVVAPEVCPGKVNVKFSGSERFSVEKVMGQRKILDKRKYSVVFPSARSSRCSARGAVKGKRLHSL